MKSDKLTADVVSPYHWVPRVCGWMALAFGVLALVGWAFDIAVLKSVIPGWITIKPNAALGISLLGGSLALLRGTASSPKKSAVGRGCAVGAIVIGALTLAETLVGTNLGIDRLLFQEVDPTTAFPGRMTVKSALNLVLLGTALLLLDRGKPRWVQTLGLVVGATVYLALIGYLFGMADVVGIVQLASLHTHLAFLLLAVGVVAAPGDTGFMTLIRNKVAWIFIRRLLPAVHRTD